MGDYYSYKELDYDAQVYAYENLLDDSFIYDNYFDEMNVIISNNFTKLFAGQFPNSNIETSCFTDDGYANAVIYGKWYLPDLFDKIELTEQEKKFTHDLATVYKNEGFGLYQTTDVDDETIGLGHLFDNIETYAESTADYYDTVDDYEFDGFSLDEISDFIGDIEDKCNDYITQMENEIIDESKIYDFEDWIADYTEKMGWYFDEEGNLYTH